MSDDAVAVDPDELRSDFKSALRGVGLSVLLIVWVVWMTYDYGGSYLIGGMGVFAVGTMLIFCWQAFRPAAQLRRADHSLF